MLTKHRFDIRFKEDNFVSEPGIKKNIDVMLNTFIDRLDTKNKAVYCGEDIYHYDKCVYALGAEFYPPSRSDRGDVTDSYIRDILQQLLSRRRARCRNRWWCNRAETAAELTKYGIQVVVLEALPMLMPRLLDEETANTLQQTIRSFSIYTNVNVQKLQEMVALKSRPG